MKAHRTSILVAATALTVMAFSTSPAEAGAPAWDSYAVKFVCGGFTSEQVVVEANYRTVVNIHNPHYLTDQIRGGGFPIPVQFFKKAVLAQPQGEPRVRPSCLQEELLFADEAFWAGDKKAEGGLKGLITGETQMIAT